MSNEISACHRGEQSKWEQLIPVLLAYQKLSQSSFKFFLSTTLLQMVNLQTWEVM